VHLVGFHYKDISRCTVLRMSNSGIYLWLDNVASKAIYGTMIFKYGDLCMNQQKLRNLLEEGLMKDEPACIVTCVLGGYRLQCMTMWKSGRTGISEKTDRWCIMQWHQKRESVANINITRMAYGETETFFSIRWSEGALKLSAVRLFHQTSSVVVFCVYFIYYFMEV
jgi:hypothetical protein